MTVSWGTASRSSSAAWERTTPALIEFKSILTAVRNLPGSSETEPERSPNVSARKK